MHTLVSKLVALSVEKYYMALTELQLKICRFHDSLSQKGCRTSPSFFCLLYVCIYAPGVFRLIFPCDVQCDEGKFKPPEVIGLTLPHKLFAVSVCITNTG